MAAGDEIVTVETTRGLLSRGISYSTVIYGGSGDDKFTTYSNQAEIRLEGQGGNDEFEVRSFALLDQTGTSSNGALESTAATAMISSSTMSICRRILMEARATIGSQ